jgi:DNA-binding MarR family transcriptional regulator
MAMQPSADAPVSEFAGQLFFRLWRISHTRAAAALEAVDLTPPLFALLNVIGTRDGAIQQHLSALLGIDPSSMVSLIDRLESAGLANRVPSPRDRRAREVTITPPGRRLLKRARRVLAEAEDEVLRGLTGDERRELVALLRRALSSAPPQSLWSAAEADEDRRRPW